MRKPSTTHHSWTIARGYRLASAVAVSLSLAALEVISLPSRLVESAIAFSVVVAALNNIYPLVTRRLWLVALGFGLVHGFGFASVLGDLGLRDETLLVALLSFNLDVELGQLAIVTAFLPLAYAVRRWQFYPQAALGLGSLAIGAIALTWFLERAFALPPIL